MPWVDLREHHAAPLTVAIHIDIIAEFYPKPVDVEAQGALRVLDRHDDMSQAQRLGSESADATGRVEDLVLAERPVLHFDIKTVRILEADQANDPPRRRRCLR
jgi:hypothetical protein